MSIRKNALLIALLASAGLAFSACDDDDDNNNPSEDTGIDTDTDEPGDTAQVRVMHASWDAPAVDIYVNGAEPEAGSAFDAIEFGEGTPYLELPAGSYDIAVVPDGAGIGDAVFSADRLALEADTALTFWAYGSLTGEGDDNAFGVGIIEDPTVPSTENATVQVAHAASGVGPVDIFVNGDETFSDVALSDSLGSATELPTGIYTVGIGVAGAGEPILDFTAPLETPAYVTVFAVGDIGDDSGVSLIALLPTGDTLQILANARVRVLHASAIANGVTPTGVDVYDTNDLDTAVVTALPFEDGTGYLSIPSGDYSFNVYATGADTAEDAAALEIPELSYSPGVAYTLIAYDNDGAISAQRLEDNQLPVEAGFVRVRFVHNADGVGNGSDLGVSVLAGANTLFEDIGIGTASATADVAAESITLGADASGNGVADLTFTVPFDAFDGAWLNAHAINDDGDVFLLAHDASGATTRVNPNP